MIHDVRFTDIHSSPKEMQPSRTCVSYGEDCISKSEFSDFDARKTISRIWFILHPMNFDLDYQGHKVTALNFMKALQLTML